MALACKPLLTRKNMEHMALIIMKPMHPMIVIMMMMLLLRMTRKKKNIMTLMKVDVSMEHDK